MKYLVIGPSWVGDMVMAQSLFITLKQKNQNAIIDVVAPNWSSPILQRMPEVRRSVEANIGHGKLAIGARRNIGKSLQAEQYDQAIVLPNSFKSALIPFWANIPIRTGWRGEMRYGLLNDLRRLDKKHLPLTVERFIALALPRDQSLSTLLPRPKMQVNTENISNALHQYGLTIKRPILGICPGAEFGASKRWPTKYYAEIALSMVKSGMQAWLFGSEKDRLIATEIVNSMPNQYQHFCHNLAGKTTLADAVDLLSLTSSVVTNDSGLMHIAAALSRPLVAIYGSSTAAHTPPMSSNHKILSLELDCSPCFQKECPLKHHNCMEQLYPQRVIQALQQLRIQETNNLSTGYTEQ